MTIEEAKRNQNELAKHYDLRFWFGTNCEKCCEVFPRFIIENPIFGGCYYKCDVCGKRTRVAPMPWVAQKWWNAHEYEEQQLTIFGG